MTKTAAALRRQTRARPIIMALEPRIMFDGAAVVDAAHAAADASAKALIPAVAAPVVVREADPAKDGGKKEVAFVDTGVADYKTLEAGIRDGVEIVEIGSGQSGLAQMAAWAETHSGYDAIHLLSHGTEGALLLGADTVTDASLSNATVQAELAEIGHALKSGGDLLLYGCDVAKGEDGQQFVTDLAQATGADVAASDDATGAGRLGGDWDLEWTDGAVTADLAITVADRQAYDHTLDTYTITFSEPLAYNDTMVDISISGTFTDGIMLGATSDSGMVYDDLSGSYDIAPRGTTGIVAFKSDGAASQDIETLSFYTVDQSSGYYNVPRSFNITSMRLVIAGGNSPLNEFGLPAVGPNEDWTIRLTPTGGSNSPVDVTIIDAANNGMVATLNWTGVTSVTLEVIKVVNSVTGVTDNDPVFNIAIDDIVLTSAASGPTVSSVTSSHADGSFKAGEVIDVTVAMSAAVTVTGTPTLTLETGTSDYVASYVAGSSDSTHLVFRYTVQAGDSSADLDFASASALSLAGGTIKAQSDNADATLTLASPGAANSLGASKAIVIDTTAPATPTVAISSDTGTNTTDGYTKTTAQTVTITAEGGAILDIDYGDGTAHGSASGAHTYAAGKYTISATATDAAGNISTAGTKVIVVDTAAPTDVTPSTASRTTAAATNGAVFCTLSAVDATNITGYTDAWTYAITGGADQGKFTIANGNELTINNTGGLSAGSYAVQVTATDAVGNTYAKALNLTVVSGPTFSSGAAANFAENGAGTAYAPTLSSSSGTVSYALSGGADQGLFNINTSTGAVTFKTTPNFEAAADSGANNVYDIIVSATDDNGTSTQSVAVTVTNVNEAPTNDAVTVTATEDATYTVTAATFSGAFHDVDAGAAFVGIKVTSAGAAAGTLYYNGSAISSAGQVVSLADLNANKLTYRAAADANGAAYATFSYQTFDGTAYSGSDATATINVSAVNDAPTRTAGTPSAISVAEDGANTNAVTLGLSGLSYGNGGGADESGQTLTYTVTVIPAAITVYKSDGTTQVTAGNTVTLAELKGLTYKTVGDAAGTGNLTWTVVDDGGGTNTLTETLAITVTGANDAPTRTAGTPSAITVNEDSANTTAVTLGLGSNTYGPGGGTDESGQALTYTVTGIPSFITLWKSDGTTSVTANTTVTSAELQGLKYKTVGDANGTGSITWTVVDNGGGADTLTETLSVTVAAVNDASVITNLGGDANSFSVGGGAITLDAGTALTITDVDSATLASATVSITTNFQTAEDVLAFTNDGSTMGNISASYTAGTGVLSMTSAGATATLAQWTAALKAVTYNDTDAVTGNTAQRTIRFVVNDGTDSSANADTTVSLVRAPILDLDTTNGATQNTTASFTEDAGAVALATNVVVSDDGSTFKALKVVITDSQDGANETLTTSAGTGSQTIGGEAVTITYTAGTHTLDITVDDGSANAASLQAIMQAVRFNDVSHTPNTASRNVTFAVRDTDNNWGSTSKSVVSVSAVNDLPTASAGSKTVNEDTALVFSAADFSYSDLDGNALSNIKITSLPAAGTLWVDSDSSGTVNGAEAALSAGDTVSAANIGKLTFKGATNANGNGYGNFQFKVNDGTADSTSAYTMTVDVGAVNDTPTRSAGSPTAISVSKDTANTTAMTLGLSAVTYGNGGGADEAAQTLTYTLTTIPNFVTVWKSDGTTQVTAGTVLTATELQGLKYKTVATATGTGNLTWTVVDNGGGATLTETLSVTVNANTAPVADNTIPNQSFATTSFSTAFAANTFSDVDGNTLTYTATQGDGSPLPSWVTFNSATRTFSGSGLNQGAKYTTTVKVTASDGSLTATSNPFTLTVDVPAPSPPPTTTTTGTIDTGTTDKGTPTKTGDSSDKGADGLRTVVRESSTTTTSSSAFSPAAALPTTGGNTSPVPVISSVLTAPTTSTFQVAVVAKAAGAADTLVVNTPVKDVAFTEGVRIAVTIPADAFAATKSDATVTLTATRVDGAALPGWMTFNPQTGTFEGTPPLGFKGEVVVKVIARDQDGHEAVQTFKIQVGEANQGQVAPDGETGEGQGEGRGQPQEGGAPGRQGDAGGHAKAASAKPVGKPSLTEQLRAQSMKGQAARHAALFDALKTGGRAA